MILILILTSLDLRQYPMVALQDPAATDLCYFCHFDYLVDSFLDAVAPADVV